MRPRAFHLILSLMFFLQTKFVVQSCGLGYKIVNKTCQDEDECSWPKSVCGENANCSNTMGSFQCNCKPGFKSWSSTSGMECLDLNECEELDVCGLNFICANMIGSYVCHCAPGYEAKGRGDIQCSDVNECERDPPVCGEHGECSNTPGGYNCVCPAGFSSHGNRSTPCKDVDECTDPVCGNTGACVNVPGSYWCNCNAGFTNFGYKQFKCVELHCAELRNTSEQTLAGLDDLMSLVRQNCLLLSNSVPEATRSTGEDLLQNLFNVSDAVVSGGRVEQSSQMSSLLGAVEDAMRLISPQLQLPLTRVETQHTDAVVAVKRAETPPKGLICLTNENAQLNTDWKTATGDGPYLGFSFAALVTYKGLESSVHSFPDPDKSTANPQITNQINSKVVTALVGNPATNQLSEPVNITLKHLQVWTESGGGGVLWVDGRKHRLNHTCVFWDEGHLGGAWLQRGCAKVSSNGTHTVCACSHLSSFAVLMALYPINDTTELKLITWVGLSLSLVCLLLCILTFALCRSIQGTRNTIHLHLCVSLFIANVVFLSGISSTPSNGGSRGGCALVAGLLHLFFLSSFCWMLLEGVQLYRMVVLVFNATLRPLYLLAFGYGVPLVMVIISAIAYPSGYGTERNCWLELASDKDGGRDFIWSFFGPVCFIIILNVLFFIVTVWKLANKFSSLNPDLTKLRKIRVFTVTAVAQLCVLGSMWIFGCFLFQEDSTVVMLYLFTLLNSLQGVLVFVMHCLFSKMVREEYGKLFACICTPQKKYSDLSSTTNHSSNSQGSKSAQVTGESRM